MYDSYVMHGGKTVLISVCVCAAVWEAGDAGDVSSSRYPSDDIPHRKAEQSCRGCHPLALVMRKLLPVPKEDLHQCFPQWELRYAIVKCASAEIRSQQQ